MPGSSFIESPYVDAVGIPLSILIMGAVATKIITAEPWSTHHWVLGVQLALAAFSVAMIKVLDLLRAFITGAAVAPGSEDIYVVAILNVALILMAISEHQDYLRRYPPDASPRDELPYLELLRVNWAGLASLGLVIYKLAR